MMYALGFILGFFALGMLIVWLAIRHFDPVERHKWDVCPRCASKEYERFYCGKDGGIHGGACEACDYYWHEEVE